MLNIKYFIGCLIVSSVLLSCTQSETFDIKGETGVKFFTNVTSPGNSAQNAVNYNVINIPASGGNGLVNLSSTIPDTIKIPVYSTKPVSNDVTIKAAFDFSLVSSYNSAHSTNYTALPSRILNGEGLVARILKDASTSVDSLTLVTDYLTINELSDNAYMAPIRLTTVSDPAVGEITSTTTSQVIYVVVNIEVRRIKYLGTTADIQGTLITPRTSWTVGFTPTPTTTGSILDGSNSTYSRWTTPVSPYGQIDVNLQASKNVTGFRLYTSSSSTYRPSKIDVYLSSDGTNYDLIGSPLRADLTFSSSYNYIVFYAAIPAQYIRLRMYYSTSTSSNNGRLAEFDVYSN